MPPELIREQSYVKSWVVSVFGVYWGRDMGLGRPRPGPGWALESVIFMRARGHVGVGGLGEPEAMLESLVPTYQ